MIDNTRIPDPPEISDELFMSCKETQDFRPVLFEWYRFVMLLCNYFSSIHPDSPMFKRLPRIQYSVCVGLMNRCSRLMLANLAHEGKFGEATAIIDRSIFESCVILSWLCQKGDTESFERYLADGLSTELVFKSSIEKNIEERGGAPFVIETRMLTSIKSKIDSSTLSESQIKNAKKLPKLSSMLDMLGHSRIMYVVGQKIGSHHIHGTWPSLTLHYLEMTPEGFWAPLNRSHSTHQNQFIFIPLSVLDAMRSFIGFCVADKKEVLFNIVWVRGN